MKLNLEKLLMVLGAIGVLIVIVVGVLVTFMVYDSIDGYYDFQKTSFKCNDKNYIIVPSIKMGLTELFEENGNARGKRLGTVITSDQAIFLDPAFETSNGIYEFNKNPDLGLVKDLSNCKSDYRLKFERYLAASKDESSASNIEVCVYDKVEQNKGLKFNCAKKIIN